MKSDKKAFMLEMLPEEFQIIKEASKKNKRSMSSFMTVSSLDKARRIEKKETMEEIHS